MSKNSDLFDQHVTTSLQRSFLKMVFECTKDASEHCFGSFDSRQVAKDVSGIYRRGLIEDKWAGLQPLHRGISVKPVWYQHFTGSYCELTSGSVKITQSCVLNPGEIPRYADFRSTLATNGQRKLFDSEDEEAAEFLYAILTYGIDCNAKEREQVAFVKIEFPNVLCSAPVDDGINLVSRYPDMAMQYLSKPSFDAAVAEKPNRKRRTA